MVHEAAAIALYETNVFVFEVACKPSHVHAFIICSARKVLFIKRHLLIAVVSFYIDFLAVAE